jgi:hypothetical protein
VGNLLPGYLLTDFRPAIRQRPKRRRKATFLGKENQTKAAENMAFC